MEERREAAWCPVGVGEQPIRTRSGDIRSCTAVAALRNSGLDRTS